MVKQKLIRIDDELLGDIEKIAKEENTSATKVINDALKYYRDFYYMQNKSTMINQDILNLTKSYTNILEDRINSKTNKYLSEIAIQSVITNMIIAKNIEVTPDEINTFRKTALNYLSKNQKILKLSELVDE